MKKLFVWFSGAILFGLGLAIVIQRSLTPNTGPILNTGFMNAPSNQRTVRFFYADNNNQPLLAESTVLKDDLLNNQIKLLLEEWLHQPQGSLAALPEMHIHSVYCLDSLAVLDFSRAFAQVWNQPELRETFCRCLALTLNENFPSIYSFQLLLEGMPISEYLKRYLPESSQIFEPARPYCVQEWIRDHAENRHF